MRRKDPRSSESSRDTSYATIACACRQFVELPPGNLEQVEALEQLRLLENGLPILVVDSVVSVPGGVDTPEDLDRVNNRAY